MAEIVFPIGRMIGGSLEKLVARTQQDGKTPRLNTDGTPMMQCNFGVAIPKAGEQHWAQTPWGNLIYEIGKAAYPLLHQTPTFAWKIIDGDSAVPNKSGKIPNQQTGYAGHWVIWFSQGWLPKLCSADGAVELQPGSIVPGYYVQVLGDVASNGAQPPNTPGLYMNPRAVALSGEGDKIITEIDTTTVGFGGALPAGARPVQPAVPGFPGAPAAGFTPPAGATPPPALPGVAPTPVVPNAAFMAAPPPPPAMPAAPVGPTMTAKANGQTYAQFIATGWTDELLRQHGYML